MSEEQTTEMELRVAKAMYEDAMRDDGVPDFIPFDGYMGKGLWLRTARAAIRAMRGPTVRMIDAGGRNIAAETQGFGGARTLERYSSMDLERENMARAAAAWDGMIDAASPGTEP